MAYAGVVRTATNHLVDAVLALLLMIGGVIGAQFGAHPSQRYFERDDPGFLLGVLVLAVEPCASRSTSVV